MAIYRSAVAVLALAGLAGCAPTTPRTDMHFGESLATLQAQQTRDPGAPLANQDRPVDGFEARTAALAVDRYYESFAKPPAPVNIINIGVGGNAR